MDNHIEGCKNFGKFGYKLFICLKLEFFWKTDYHRFCLSSKPHHATTFQTNPLRWWSLNIRLHNFGPNWFQIVCSPQKRFFVKIGCYYCLPTIFCHATTFRKNSQRENQDSEVRIILAKIGCKLYLQKWIFCSSLPTLL